MKLQEELKSSRQASKIAQADLEEQKARGMKREQEAFNARYQLVGVQEELGQMQEQIKLVEQERDALRMIAKNEEIARIAAEGRIPLPTSANDDEFASPKKARKSLDLKTITSSAASEEELDEMRLLLEWEQHNAKRAHDRIEFLEAECRLNCCTSKESRDASSTFEHVNKKQKTEQPSTVFIPSEGVFRTMSPMPEESPWISPAKNSAPIKFPEPIHEESRVYARTPSCEPPALAIPADINTSLLSLLDAPHSPSPTPSPVMTENSQNTTENNCGVFQMPPERTSNINTTSIPTFHTISTTTRIPLSNPPDLTPQTITIPVKDKNDALSPTMSREEALAQIRERRGRARSLAQGTMTPRKQMIDGAGVRRDISAPSVRIGDIRGRSQARVQTN